MKKQWLILFLIIIAAAFLRFYKLTEIPSGFFFDEVTAGVNGNFLSQNLHDEFGHFLPDFIAIGDDFRHVTIFYASALFIKIFGLSEFSVRAATATFGVLIVALTYFLAHILTKDKKIALVTTAFVAISPWLLNLSRSSNEVILALFFLMAADISLLLAISKAKRIYFVLAYLFMVLTWYSYSGAILTTLLHLTFFLVYGLFSKKSQAAKIGIIVVFTSFLLFPNLFYYIFQPKKITGRFDQVSIFSQKGTQLVLDEQIREDGTGKPTRPQISRFFHNKPANYFYVFINNYTTYFSGQYLVGPDARPLRYKIPGAGLLYYMDIPFLLLGIYFLLHKPNWNKTFLLFWFFAGPVSASLTLEDTPNMQRSIFMNPAIQIIVAVGIVQFFQQANRIKNKRRIIPAMTVLTFGIYSYFFLYFMHQFLIHQPRHQNWYRNSEWKEAVQTIEKLEPNYQQIKVTNPLAHYYLMFYSQNYRNTNGANPNYLKNRNINATWSLGKYTFVNQDCFSIENGNWDTLYVVGQNCEDIPPWARKLKEAKTSDGVVMMTFFDVPLQTKK